MNKKAVPVMPVIRTIAPIVLPIIMDALTDAIKNEIRSLPKNKKIKVQNELDNSNGLENLSNDTLDLLDKAYYEAGSNDVVEEILEDSYRGEEIALSMLDAIKNVILNQLLLKIDNIGKVAKHSRLRMKKTALFDNMWELIRSTVISYVIKKLIDLAIDKLNEYFQTDEGKESAKEIAGSINNIVDYNSCPDIVKTVLKKISDLIGLDTGIMEALGSQLGDSAKDVDQNSIDEVKNGFFDELIKRMKDMPVLKQAIN